MKANYTHVGILLDRSGSMAHLANDTIGGFNNLIKEQKAEPGELTVTLASFSTDYTTIYDTIPVKEVQDLTSQSYRPSGGTALNDSFARLINEVGAKLAAMKEEDRPSKVLLISFTDGEENSSKEISTKQLKEIIQHQEQKYGWQFIYMGANQDSFEEGVQMRGYTQAMNFMASSEGTRTAYHTMSAKLKSYRSKGKLDDNDLAQKQKQAPNPLTTNDKDNGREGPQRKNTGNSKKTS